MKKVFSTRNRKNNISLIGFMGSGKSTVGRVLQNYLGALFIQSDQLIINKEKASISEIFNNKGEVFFREREIEVIKEICDNLKLVSGPSKKNVIDCGGGVILNQININRLKETSVIVFLDVKFSEILKRTKNDKTRPLLRDKAKAKRLYSFRRLLYNEYADIKVKADKKTPECIAREIIELINKP